ncbi:hypothetical protein BS47DRAFT_1381690 [Hydnum rufescens UP504]|uniref:Zn(2)-C6 fungal-type domain-containing protein n=1 Tax=Hydnum rufescens UP504 TaxID=1448309 RepID=A0A9P6DV68_9AGAM|nr:hypothetical protein BS47DRAFT_1381690 [Hydnum rufescens UP504]
MPHARASIIGGNYPFIPTTLGRGEACFGCRKHKTKCDGRKPSCVQCEIHGRRCAYITPVSRVKKLEERVKELESQLQDAVDYSPLVLHLPIMKASLPDPVDLTLHTHPAPPMTRDAAIQSLLAWDPNHSMSHSLRLNLFDTFLNHQAQYSVDVYLPRFRERVNLPSTHPDGLHPSLVNAILLATSSSFGPDAKPYEDLFLRRAREQFQHSLAHADRLEDFFWACIITTWYYIRNGRIHEAYHLATNIGPQHASFLHLRDMFEVAERINIWWSVYLVERRLSLYMALPGGLPHGAHPNFTTPWPRSFSDVARYGLDNWPNDGLNGLLSRGATLTTVASDSLLGLRAKSIALLARAAWSVYTSRSSVPEEFWVTHVRTDNAISRVQETLPSVKEEHHPMTGDTVHQINPTLVHIHITTYTSVIITHQVTSDVDPSAYEKCLKAARAMAAVTRDIHGDLSMLYAQTFLGPMLCSGAQFLEQEIKRLHASGSPDHVPELRNAQQDLASIAYALWSLVGLYPGLVLHIVPYLHRIRSLLDD